MCTLNHRVLQPVGGAAVLSHQDPEVWRSVYKSCYREAASHTGLQSGKQKEK